MYLLLVIRKNAKNIRLPTNKLHPEWETLFLKYTKLFALCLSLVFAGSMATGGTYRKGGGGALVGKGVGGAYRKGGLVGRRERGGLTGRER